MPASLKAQLQEKDQQIVLLHAISRIASEASNLDELLQKLAQLVVQRLKADSALIYLYDEAREELVLRGAHNPHPQQVGHIKMKLGEGVTGWAAEKKKPVAIAKKASEDPRFKLFSTLKEDKFEALLSVPIVLKGDLVGVLNACYRKAHQHNESEIDLATYIANEIAGAIAHSRAHHQARKKSQQIEALARMSESIAQGIYLREILHLIVTMTAEMMGSKICSLMLMDEKGKELKIEATQSLSEEYRAKPPIKVLGSVSGRAVQEKRPVIVDDVTRDPQYAYPEIAKKENLKSLIIVPMMNKERPIGVLNCYTTDTHAFSHEETQLLQTVANQAAIAIEHTRVVEKALAAEEALETRKQVERAKGILMRSQNISEETAYRIIQRQAMDRRKSMKEVAEALILSDELHTGK